MGHSLNLSEMLAQLSPWSDVEKATYLAKGSKRLPKQFTTRKLYDYDIGIALENCYYTSS